MTEISWKHTLGARIPAAMAEEIDAFETLIALKRQGRVDDRLFAETRLRRGIYGQRYDNGVRHDGVASRRLVFPSGELTKGPDTAWDAPGMLRIKIPFGGLRSDQLLVLADLAEEYSDAILHVTTRQDFQLHFVHLEDTPDLMRRLAAVGITTLEACGNSVRNVTACPLAGVCQGEPFDVTPYASALAYYLLGHRDAQDFGRKFKIAFSGCGDQPCGLAHMHDLGFIARTRGEERGFTVLVGGGLGAVPHRAVVLFEFTPEHELLPQAQAVCRVFGRLGEKKNRARARLKFLVAKLGIAEFRRLVEAERLVIPGDERWTACQPLVGDGGHGAPEPPARAADTVTPHPEFEAWRAVNVASQRQAGFGAAAIALPLGDLSSAQARQLAAIADRFAGGELRTTVEQNVLLRFVRDQELPALHHALLAAGLAAPTAGTVVDVTACPGTDTCKLGISSSRGLAGELRRRLATLALVHDEAVRHLRIKVSGCFNSCGQHHVADIGFYGSSRRHDGRTVPHFQVVLGGETRNNAGSYGLAVVAVPSKRIPDVVERLLATFVRERERGERFPQFVTRHGKAKIRALLDDLTVLPSYAEGRELYSDWGDPREYTIGDIGVGECAGEVVPLVEFGLQASERQAFEAQLLLESGSAQPASERAFRAMVQAAHALARLHAPDLPEDETEVVREFKQRFCDTGLFHDRYAGAKFANYLFAAHEERAAGTAAAPVSGAGADAAHRRIEEAQLFIDAAHAARVAAGSDRGSTGHQTNGATNGSASNDSDSSGHASHGHASRGGVESDRHGNGHASHEAAHRRVEEALLFIEAAHACYQRLGNQASVSEVRT